MEYTMQNEYSIEEVDGGFSFIVDREANEHILTVRQDSYTTSIFLFNKEVKELIKFLVGEFKGEV